MNVEIIQGDDAQALLRERAFHAQWESLHGTCPWATPFQSAAFIFTWYQAYRETHEPMLLLRRTADGTLDGALPLAASTSDRALVAAGAWQAEYQCWISRPQIGEDFARSAIQALQHRIPGRGLHLRYLPPGTPIQWLNECQTAILQSHPRPLLRLGDGKEIATSLAKHANKSRLRRLKQLGPVELKQITDPNEFCEILQTTALWHDARRLAINGATPFRSDPNKLPFHLAMFEQPQLLHVTALRAGDQTASVQVNLQDARQAHMCLIAHNPWLGKSSPGKIHTLMLARALAQESYEQIDLTPGGDLYKERFANAFDEVHSVSFFATRPRRIASALVGGLRDVCRATLLNHGITPAQALLQARKLHPARLAAGLWGGSQATSLHCRTIDRTDFVPAAPIVQRDSLEDLMTYQPPNSAWPRRQELLSDALRRFELGQHIYTRIENNRLVSFGWLAECGDDDGDVPPDTAIVRDLRTIPSAAKCGYESECLAAILEDMARLPQVSRIAIRIERRDRSALDLVKTFGFRPATSIPPPPIKSASPVATQRARSATLDSRTRARTGALHGIR